MSGNVHLFSRLYLCYNTGHDVDAEFNLACDGEFIPFHDCVEGS